MPTRLDVLLHRRKSAAAGPVDKVVSGRAANRLANSAPRDRYATMVWLIPRLGSSQTQILFQPAGLSTTIARKSVTLVNVGPGTKRSPMALKNPVESLSARKAAGSRPSPLALARLVSSIRS